MGCKDRARRGGLSVLFLHAHAQLLPGICRLGSKRHLIVTVVEPRYTVERRS
jgi:hypothetical protein